ncbi:hypothetical protein [Metalysinibacillus jejuensis]|uniref:hypothetical protein n=1 Tax=Metalysinibacillus jejuensis TaxID=914327 RepID=UPI000D342D38|nr:hypothetical protein [Metalysinibacillus jejuensis]
MNITAIYSIGKMSFPSPWLALVLTFILTGIILRSQFSKTASAQYSDFVLTFILVWKFSVILTDFKMVLQQPLTILYFNGGKLGVVLASLAVFVQAYRKRATFSFAASAWAIALTQSGYQIIMVLVNDNAQWIELTTLFISSIALLMVVRKPTIATLQGFMGLHFIIALLQPVALTQQLSWLLTIVATLAVVKWQKELK